jgi:hypothetical protein
MPAKALKRHGSPLLKIYSQLGTTIRLVQSLQGKRTLAPTF